MEEGGGEEDFLAHALGVRGELGVAVIPECEGAEEFVHARFEDAARHAAESAAELEVLAGGEVGVEVGVFGNVADGPR